MSNPIISVEGLSKRYIISHQQNGKDGLRHSLENVLRNPFRWLAGLNKRLRDMREEFWALKDISFEVNRGDILGIIGRNGAGKSTLLKLLSRITEPSTGTIRLNGRVASLLEVGTGFHQELTGRENIFLNGAILGMRREEIRRKFDDIVAFSEVEQFLDTPVKRYSSGMYVRLAFAVAAHLEPEILIVDEVLAVGDAEFQKKCLGRMAEVAHGGRTVIFVSHNMVAVKRLCSKGLILKNGNVELQGTIQECIDRYAGNPTVNSQLTWERTASDKSIGMLVFKTLNACLTSINQRIEMHIRCVFMANRKHLPAFVAFDFMDSSGATIMQAIPSLKPFVNPSSESQQCHFMIELPGLIPGRYYISAWIGPHNNETYDYIDKAISFDITESPTPGRTYPHSNDHGFMVPTSEVVSIH